MERHGLDERAAFELLRDQARSAAGGSSTSPRPYLTATR